MNYVIFNYSTTYFTFSRPISSARALSALLTASSNGCESALLLCYFPRFGVRFLLLRSRFKFATNCTFNYIRDHFYHNRASRFASCLRLSLLHCSQLQSHFLVFLSHFAFRISVVVIIASRYA